MHWSWENSVEQLQKALGTTVVLLLLKALPVFFWSLIATVLKFLSIIHMHVNLNKGAPEIAGLDIKECSQLIIEGVSGKRG